METKELIAELRKRGCRNGGSLGWHSGLCDEVADRLEYLNEVCEDLQIAVERVGKKLQIARAERDLAREKLARITGEREAAWLEEKPVPMDNGEYVPEAPREGM